MFWIWWFLNQMKSFLLYCKNIVKYEENNRNNNYLIYVFITVCCIEVEWTKCKSKKKLARCLRMCRFVIKRMQHKGRTAYVCMVLFYRSYLLRVSIILILTPIYNHELKLFHILSFAYKIANDNGEKNTKKELCFLWILNWDTHQSNEDKEMCFSYPSSGIRNRERKKKQMLSIQKSKKVIGVKS